MRAGDTLSAIAGRNQRPGVSLDQMLVSLYRGNPEAFIGDNMNRLKSGVVLSVPSPEAAKQTSPAEAKQLIQAQSADFGAYRQRLAGLAPTVKTDTATRQATGKVQASVDDRKQAATTTPDKLKLSQGGVKGTGPEAKLSKEAEKIDASTRVAELTRNVEELKKIAPGAAPAAPATPGKPAAATPTPAPAAAPAVAAKSPPVPVPAPAPAPAPAAKPPPAPTVVAAAPTPAPAPPPPPPPPPAPVPAPPPPPPPAPVPAPAPAPSASPASPAATPTLRADTPASAVAGAKPPIQAVTPAAAEEPGLLGSLMDSPFVLPVASLLVALLAGLGFYRWRNRNRKESGETSFLESRLQPDSFFGASGGQRIDTRDAGTASSSMSYSLSQLDAIGDVDPVAEADVYLAYGRDLQAEEILKEAMRGNPERLAIRTKLLEVYAKRRDSKGFELLATQLFAITRGEGDDWAKAQEMGLGIDPENPLYQPGGKPPAVLQGGDPSAEPLGASTMPQSILPSSSTFTSTVLPHSSLADLDLDLDLGDASAPAASPAEATKPLTTSAIASMVDFDLPPAAAATPAPPREAAMPATMDFDLGTFSLDPPSAPAAAAAPARTEPTLPLGDLGLPSVTLSGSSEFGDSAFGPLLRKLELAEEFRQIGDSEGARDLLEEVVAKSSGNLKTRAQGMLDSLV